MRIIVLAILINVFGVCYSQIDPTEELEKRLKRKNTDTIVGWKRGGTVTLNMSQVSLTNWSSGGQSSMSVNGLVSLFAHYRKNKGLWENYLDVGYGSLKQENYKNWWKTDDKIDFTSKYGRRAFSNFYYAGLLNFKTQMDEGYNYPNDSVIISGLLAPGYLLGAIGLDYKPDENFTVFAAILTSKITFVNNQTLADSGAFGVEPAVLGSNGEVIIHGKKVREEIGGYVRMFYKKDIMENITLQTKLDLFSNYIKNPQNIDVSWEVLISMKVNKFISATVTTHLLYDDDIDIEIDNNNDGKIDEKGPRVQFKEVLGVGFSYKF